VTDGEQPTDEQLNAAARERIWNDDYEQPVEGVFVAIEDDDNTPAAMVAKKAMAEATRRRTQLELWLLAQEPDPSVGRSLDEVAGIVEAATPPPADHDDTRNDQAGGRTG
jgi:hypothetical protein